MHCIEELEAGLELRESLDRLQAQKPIDQRLVMERIGSGLRGDIHADDSRAAISSRRVAAFS
jgi:hypothetical protein